MNELEKKVKKIIHNDKGQVELIIKDISKFFLEEIKQAWNKGQDAVEWNQLSGWKVNQTFDDYLKSKYKI